MNYFDLYDQEVQPGCSRDQQRHESILEETADRISKPLARALQALHGDVLDFEALTRPLAYLAIYQCAPGRRTPAAVEPGLVESHSYKALASARPGDATHALLLQLSASEQPLATALRWVRSLPNAEKPVPELRAKPKSRATRVGISFGTSFGERLQLHCRRSGRLKFLRGARVTATGSSRELRQSLLEQLETSASAEQDLQLRSIIVYLALVMPIFLLENFNRYVNLAQRQASRLQSLIIGTEFQRKPDIAILIALMRSQKKKIVGIQHGGGYGQTDPNWWERAERFLCDRYRTWGYEFDPRDQPLPSIKLSRQAIKAKHSGRGKSYTGLELRILLAIPYISEELECSLYSPPYQSQVAAVESSLAILHPLLERDCQLTIRLHPKNKGARFIETLSVAGSPKVQFSTGVRGSIAEDVGKYTALFFSSPQATGVAECLAAGCTFYVAASPDFFWIRDEAAAQYEEMNRCGIWVTRFDQVEQLMQSGFETMSHRQHVFRHNFTKIFACHSDSYLVDWARMLKNA